MAFKIDINSDAFVFFTEKLERLPKTVLPKAVKETLNAMALDLKKNTMPKSANRNFVNREKNFFKANSKINFAKGSDISFMSAEIGFLSQTSKKNKQAVEDLTQQEKGGTIGGRKYIPTKNARISKNSSKKISKKNRLKEIGIRNIVRSSDVLGKSRGQKFVHAVFLAGRGGFVQSKLKNGVKMVWRVNSLNRTKKGQFKLTAMYIVNDSKTIKVNRATHFMKNASEETHKIAPKLFTREAKNRFERHLRKR